MALETSDIIYNVVAHNTATVKPIIIIYAEFRTATFEMQNPKQNEFENVFTAAERPRIITRRGWLSVMKSFFYNFIRKYKFYTAHGKANIRNNSNINDAGCAFVLFGAFEFYILSRNPKSNGQNRSKLISTRPFCHNWFFD